MSAEIKCRECLTSQPIDNYGTYIGISGNTVRRKMCRGCRNTQQAKLYATNPGVRVRMKNVARARSLKKAYNISAADYDAMFAAQEGKCRICRTKAARHLDVDHCHTTGRVRGLLCWNCNIAIGHFKDSPVLLQRAIDYLTTEKAI